MKRIIIHWTAGTYKPNSIDKEHYHFLIDGDGNIVKGTHSVKANENCMDGEYAAHTGGGNTGSIGVALCGMRNFKSKYDCGDFPLQRKQCEVAFEFIAELCKMYSIPITPETVMTHYEFGKKHPNSSSAGKIDIIYLPPYPSYIDIEIGNLIRSKVRWYYNK